MKHILDGCHFECEVSFININYWISLISFIITQKASYKLQKPEVTGTLHGIKCDLSKPDEISAMFAEIKEKYGGVDVCVNNAGLAHPSNLLEGETEDWRHMLDVSLKKIVSV